MDPLGWSETPGGVFRLDSDSQSNSFGDWTDIFNQSNDASDSPSQSEYQLNVLPGKERVVVFNLHDVVLRIFEKTYESENDKKKLIELSEDIKTFFGLNPITYEYQVSRVVGYEYNYKTVGGVCFIRPGFQQFLDEVSNQNTTVYYYAPNLQKNAVDSMIISISKIYPLIKNFTLKGLVFIDDGTFKLPIDEISGYHSDSKNRIIIDSSNEYFDWNEAWVYVRIELWFNYRDVNVMELIEAYNKNKNSLSGEFEQKIAKFKSSINSDPTLIDVVNYLRATPSVTETSTQAKIIKSNAMEERDVFMILGALKAISSSTSTSGVQYRGGVSYENQPTQQPPTNQQSLNVPAKVGLTTDKFYMFTIQENVNPNGRYPTFYYATWRVNSHKGIKLNWGDEENQRLEPEWTIYDDNLTFRSPHTALSYLFNNEIPMDRSTKFNPRFSQVSLVGDLLNLDFITESFEPQASTINALESKIGLIKVNREQDTLTIIYWIFEYFTLIRESLDSMDSLNAIFKPHVDFWWAQNEGVRVADYRDFLVDMLIKNYKIHQTDYQYLALVFNNVLKKYDGFYFKKYGCQAYWSTKHSPTISNDGLSTSKALIFELGTLRKGSVKNVSLIDTPPESTRFLYNIEKFESLKSFKIKFNSGEDFEYWVYLKNIDDKKRQIEFNGILRSIPVCNFPFNWNLLETSESNLSATKVSESDVEIPNVAEMSEDFESPEPPPEIFETPRVETKRTWEDELKDSIKDYIIKIQTNFANLKSTELIQKATFLEKLENTAIDNLENLTSYESYIKSVQKVLTTLKLDDQLRKTIEGVYEPMLKSNDLIALKDIFGNKMIHQGQFDQNQIS